MKALRSILLVSLFLFLCVSTVYAQWTQSDQTTGSVVCFTVKGANLFNGRWGSGVFLSTDNGATWTAAGLAGDNVDALATVGAGNLFAGTAYGGAGTGVYRSTNNGTNWTAVNTNLTSTNVYSFAVDMSNNLYAGTGDGVFSLPFPYTTWTAAGLTGNGVGALVYSNPNLFAGIYGSGVFLSTDNGTNWAAVNTGLTNLNVNALIMNGGNLFAGTDGGGVFLSTNNGTNWTAVNTGLTNLTVHAFAAAGPNLFAGTDDRVFLSTDNGTSWTPVNTGLNLSNNTVHALAVIGGKLVAGTHLDGVWSRSATVSGTRYYSKSGTDPSSLSNWNSNTDGTSGSTPANFTTSGDIFQIQSAQTLTCSSPWALTAVTLQIAGTLNLTNTLTIDGGGQIGVMGTLNVSSTVTLTGSQMNVTGGSALVFSGAGIISGTGTFICQNQSNLTINNATGITGNITTTTNTFNCNGTTITYNGSGAQHTGTGLGSGVLIILNNINGLTLDESLTVNRFTLNGPITANGHTISWTGTNPTLIYNASSGTQSSGIEFPASPAADFILSIDNTSGNAVALNISDARTIGTLQLRNGTFSISGGGSLAFPAVQYAQTSSYTTTALDWPASGVTQVNINNSVGVILDADRSGIAQLVLTNGILNLNGHHLTLNDGATITRLAGSISDVPTPAGSYSLMYNGSGSQQILGAEVGASYTLTDLNVSSSLGIKLGSHAITVTGTLTVGGNIDLNGQTLTLGSSPSSPGTLGSGSQYLSNGTFTRYINTTGLPTDFTPTITTCKFPFGSGNDPRVVFICFTSNPITTGGTISVSHTNVAGTTSVSPGSEGGLLIDKRSNSSWTISQSGLDLGVKTMSLQLTAGNIGGVTDYTQLNMMLATTFAGGNHTTAQGNNGAPMVSRIGMTLSDIANTFYVGSTSTNALPVQMTKFTVTSKKMNTELQWSTATEVNCYGFEVERRMTSPLSPPYQGGDVRGGWQKIGFVQGAGTSNSPKDYSYTDASVASGTYAYRLKQIDNDGTFEYSSEAEITLSVPKVFALDQNYPNPFNPSTTINFTLAEDSHVSLRVFDMLGREVATLANGEMKAGEVHNVLFDASRLSSGLYFYRLDAGKSSLVKKLVLMK